MIFKPTMDNIIIKPEIEDNSKTDSGIIIATKLQQKPQVGVVIAMGEGRTLNNGTILKSSVNVGDTILFNKFAGVEIKANDEDYLIIKETDILATILKE